jgi:hypothetical protein
MTEDTVPEFDLESHGGPDAGGHDGAAHGEGGHGEDGHADGGHAGHARHGGHGGHGDGHGGGGHGGNWIVTYCDMITLLIAFFICILTFASQESGKGDHRKLRDSVLYGQAGSGIAGSNKPGDPDAFVWRKVLLSHNPAKAGSPVPPLYSDPTLELTRRALAMLEEAPEVTLADSYTASLPAAVLFDDRSALTKSGRELLHMVANNIYTLPVDLYVEVEGPAQLPRALVIAQHFIRREALPPARVGVGTATAGGRPGYVRLVFVKQPRDIRN